MQLFFSKQKKTKKKYFFQNFSFTSSLFSSSFFDTENRLFHLFRLNFGWPIQSGAAIYVHTVRRHFHISKFKIVPLNTKQRNARGKRHSFNCFVEPIVWEMKAQDLLIPDNNDNDSYSPCRLPSTGCRRLWLLHSTHHNFTIFSPFAYSLCALYARHPATEKRKKNSVSKW